MYISQETWEELMKVFKNSIERRVEKKKSSYDDKDKCEPLKQIQDLLENFSHDDDNHSSKDYKKWDHDNRKKVDDFYSRHDSHRFACTCRPSHHSQHDCSHHHEHHHNHKNSHDHRSHCLHFEHFDHHNHCCHHEYGNFRKGHCCIPFSSPKFDYCNDRFRLRLAGLTGNINFLLLKSQKCKVIVHFSRGEEIHSVSGKICDVGTDYISVRKSDGTVVTIFKSQINSIEWPNKKCNPCTKCHNCSCLHCSDYHDHCDCGKDDNIDQDDLDEPDENQDDEPNDQPEDEENED